MGGSVGEDSVGEGGGRVGEVIRGGRGGGRGEVSSLTGSLSELAFIRGSSDSAGSKG